jgi:2-polyprenyl-6-methoxyphenol hydroxylase-like FAD-dependent oxidoreductase
MAGKALVIGAGVGGLSTGLALKNAGYDVVVCERHPELRTAGVGLNLWPNGVRVLDELGLSETFMSVSNVIAQYRTFSSDGEPVSAEDTGAYRARFGAPLTGVYRRDLNALIAEALGRERIRFEHELVEFDDSGDAVECRFANGASESGHLLVGADGVFSRVRRQLFGEIPFRADKHVRWRGLFNVADAKVAPDQQVDVIGADAHIGWLPIGKGRAYWYAAGDGLDDREAALGRFNSWTKTRIPEIIAVTPVDSIIRNDLFDLDPPLDEWGRGRVTLLGDGAHPMLPGMAQGANQALEDTSMLVRCLAEGDGVEEALRRYEATRIPKAKRIVHLSRSLFDFEGESAAVSEMHNYPLFQRYAQAVEGWMAANA